MRGVRLSVVVTMAAVLWSPLSARAQPTTRGWAPTALPASIPIFPLEDVMLFPGATRPLHIFEQRYRDMVADALEGDRLIGIVLLEPGNEATYDGNPPVFAIGCVGVIAEAERLPDGRYNILLGGLSKFRITGEDQSRSYRVATIEPIPEELTVADRAALGDLREELTMLLPIGLPGVQIPDGLGDEDVVNGIAQLIALDPLDRLGLLEQPDALARGQALIDLLYIRSALPR
jgi:Lon protease-like protein